MNVRRAAVWLAGGAVLASVIVIALHLSEPGAFVRLAERAEPWWLSVAAALQLGTYLAQGEVWRRAARAAGHRLTAAQAFGLSLAKLFADQAMPSAGVSSSVVVARALERMTIPPTAASAAVLLNLAAYHLAYVVTLVPAMVILTRAGDATALVIIAAGLFALLAAAVAAVILRLAGGGRSITGRAARWFGWARPAVTFIEQADQRLVRNPRLLTTATALQVAIVLLDTATMWALLRSLGTQAAPSAVFGSFMVASLVRTLGVVPGGLGTFEAASVVTLTLIRATLPVALAATLLFRGLSFWLPMLPGIWITRRMLRPVTPTMPSEALPYWSMPPQEVLKHLDAQPDGLSSPEAARRLDQYGRNTLTARRASTRTRVLLNQLRSPLLLLLVFAAGASAVTSEWMDATIVFSIVCATVAVGYMREYSAETAAAALRARVKVRVRARRDGLPVTIDIEEAVPGDVVLLGAGSLVPGDGLILEATDFYVSEAALTGESFPVHKRAGEVPPHGPIAGRLNCVFMGTNVRSGSARCLIVHTGTSTEFGRIAERLIVRPPETEFDRGLRHFGYLLTTAMLLLVVVIFSVHMVMGRPAIETLLFAIALAVGLSPELLPAILNVNLARSAQAMAARGVLVRRLNAIENLGSMDVLCTDKTGTITEGVIRLDGAYDASAQPSSEVQLLAACNAALESGLDNPLDEAILAAGQPDVTGIRKLGEVPFDFSRKRVSVVIERGDRVELITKGAFHGVLAACSTTPDGAPLDDTRSAALEQLYERWSSQGIRVLAVARRDLPRREAYSRLDECDLTFAGFLTFLDRPEDTAALAIKALASLGVAVKLITGDNASVTRHVAAQVGLDPDRLLTGADLDAMTDEALQPASEQTTLFAELDPRQKERIIAALRKRGHVVGFLGDGVNDAPAMHAADTSLSVERAVDVARQAADFVLLERGLDVIRRGIEEGRTTFANTLKYVLTTTSANLGNMVSMAVASLALPFLPLLASQILLNNFLSDIPAVGIADDNVDPEMVAQPERWNMRFIGRFMVEFGLLSSAFDVLTFAVLLGGFRAGEATFRTAWFVESLLTELVIALVVRTRRSAFRSQPGRLLLVSTAVLVPVSLVVPYLPFAGVLGFVPLSLPVLTSLVLITGAYVAAAEASKHHFYRSTPEGGL